MKKKLFFIFVLCFALNLLSCNSTRGNPTNLESKPSVILSDIQQKAYNNIDFIFEANVPSEPNLIYFPITQHETAQTFLTEMIRNDIKIIEKPQEELLHIYQEWQNGYVKKLIEYEKIVTQSPLKVVFQKPSIFFNTYLIKTNLKTLNSSALLGIYIEDNKIEGWPKQFIFVSKKLLPTAKIAVYYHELQHHNCYEKKCICISTSFGWVKELHAMEYALQQGINNEMPEVIREIIGDTISYILDDKQFPRYRFAAMILKNKSIWNEAIAYVISTEEIKE